MKAKDIEELRGGLLAISEAIERSSAGDFSVEKDTKFTEVLQEIAKQLQWLGNGPIPVADGLGATLNLCNSISRAGDALAERLGSVAKQLLAIADELPNAGGRCEHVVYVVAAREAGEGEALILDWYSSFGDWGMAWKPPVEMDETGCRRFEIVQVSTKGTRPVCVWDRRIGRWLLLVQG